MADTLQLLNVGLARRIPLMDDDEMFEFLASKVDEANQVADKFSYKTWLFICLNDSFELFEKRYWESMKYEASRIDLEYTLILDFAFQKPKIKLDYYGTGGFYDNPASCDAPKSDTLMPVLHEESDELFEQRDFYLLDAPLLDPIIRALEANLDELKDTTAAEIETIRGWRELVAADDGFRVAYIYNEWR
ncbi:MAG: hypothetical protein JSS81_02255 [Acidobacteria bacterium]|nr:hypothetical protein [Acidobacteriota bacterium]